MCDLYTTERINSITLFFFFLFYYVGNVSKESQSAVSSGCSAGCFIHLSLRQTCTFSTVCGVGSYGRAAVAHTEKKTIICDEYIFSARPQRNVFGYIFEHVELFALNCLLDKLNVSS